MKDPDDLYDELEEIGCSDDEVRELNPERDFTFGSGEDFDDYDE